MGRSASATEFDMLLQVTVVACVGDMVDALFGELQSRTRKNRVVFTIDQLQDLDSVLGPFWWMVIHNNNVHSLVDDIKTVELVYDTSKKVRVPLMMRCTRSANFGVVAAAEVPVRPHQVQWPPSGCRYRSPGSLPYVYVTCQQQSACHDIWSCSWCPFG
jgi:hypothetical protein